MQGIIWLINYPDNGKFNIIGLSANSEINSLMTQPASHSVEYAGKHVVSSGDVSQEDNTFD